MSTVFNESFHPEWMDRKAFKFGHKLLGHPALALDNLAQVIPTLPQSNVMYSKGLLDTADDFEGTFKKRPQDCSIEETIENIRTTDSYIMVRRPEDHPSFAELHRALEEEVAKALRLRGVNPRVMDPHLYLFIASPNSVTPFHIDRYSTFLMQFRGSKQVCVHPQWDERVVTPEDTEAYVVFERTKLPWTPEVDRFGTTFEFRPGEALHIPFLAGHHVRNGPDDVSISMSIIFNTEESWVWRRALTLNHMLRQRLGMRPSPIGHTPWLDTTKSNVLRVRDKVSHLLGR